ncbi:type I glyceraldehyde-3-phosphate dehydrogenase [Candidatus Shapirobacteria bacterium]|nr:type I glyceraldehyde-3-phosphate dehydrogenase [Candidatus Shapirobacteria bacterium]
MVRIAINGFGRTGRAAFRAALTRHDQEVEIVAINTSGSMEASGWAHLLKYDSVYGRFSKEVGVVPPKRAAEIGRIKVGEKEYPILAEKDPAKIPWNTYSPDVVLEITSFFRDKESATKHLKSGAGKVIIAAPPKGKEVPIYIMGVNSDSYKGEDLVSNASCTTNCAAPIVKLMQDYFEIDEAAMTTIHAYTSDQELVDGSHKDLRRARAAAINIVPTSTGAAESIIAVFPKLEGRFSGAAIRVPVACGSFSDFTFRLKTKTTIDRLNRLFEDAANGAMKGILEVSYEPLVSSDIIGNSASSIVDSALTEVVREDLVKIGAWYDNEWAYSCRLIEMAILMSQK